MSICVKSHYVLSLCLPNCEIEKFAIFETFRRQILWPWLCPLKVTEADQCFTGLSESCNLKLILPQLSSLDWGQIHVSRSILMQLTIVRSNRKFCEYTGMSSNSSNVISQSIRVLCWIPGIASNGTFIPYEFYRLIANGAVLHDNAQLYDSLSTEKSREKSRSRMLIVNYLLLISSITHYFDKYWKHLTCNIHFSYSEKCK